MTARKEGTWINCPECGGWGYTAVPDNGTNLGEEDCDYCADSPMEGRILVDEWGDRIED